MGIGPTSVVAANVRSSRSSCVAIPSKENSQIVCSAEPKSDEWEWTDSKSKSVSGAVSVASQRPVLVGFFLKLSSSWFAPSVPRSRLVGGSEVSSGIDSSRDNDDFASALIPGCSDTAWPWEPTSEVEVLSNSGSASPNASANKPGSFDASSASWASGGLFGSAADTIGRDSSAAGSCGVCAMGAGITSAGVDGLVGRLRRDERRGFPWEEDSCELSETRIIGSSGPAITSA